MSFVAMDGGTVVMLRVVVIGVVVDVRTREWTRGNDGQCNQRDQARAGHIVECMAAPRRGQRKWQDPDEPARDLS
jgi:hypothetical protein